MKRLLSALRRVLSPGLGWMLLLIPVSAAALIHALGSERETTLFHYLAYGLSAYTLAALLLGLPGFQREFKRFFRENPRMVRIKNYFYRHKYIGRYLTNLPLRVQISLYVSLSINLTYAVLLLIMGVYYTSFWFGAESVFYLSLGLMRFWISRHMGKSGDLRHEYRVYRFCGALLFVLTATLTGVVYQMIYQNRGHAYPGLLIYAVAAYTFLFLIRSVVHLIQYRKLNRPVIIAVKVINLATALVSLYSLQIAMFASFGDGQALEFIMNSIFGVLLCAAIFSAAVLMVVRGSAKLRGLGSREP